MQLLLSESEAKQALEAIQNGLRQDNGNLLVDLPSLSSDLAETPGPVFQFLSDSQTVRYGRQSVHLSPTLFSLMQCIYEHGRIGFEAVQDFAWKRETSDIAIRRACSRLSEKLMDAGIQYVAVTTRGHIVLEETIS
jgi:hypothetical protein